MKSPVEQAKATLELVANDPEALLVLISGAIDRLNTLDEGAIGQAFKETWQSQYISTSMN